MFLVPVIVAVLLGIALFLFFFDANDLLVPILPLRKTNEAHLELRDGLMCDRLHQPFTGTTVYRGPVEPGEDGKYRPRGKRVTRYRDGLKEGEERVYYTDPIPYRRKTRTVLHRRTHYQAGAKHGLEIENYRGSECFRHTETSYAHGLIDGICKEYEYLRRNHVDEKNVGRKCGPLVSEIAYRAGVQSGIYRTYSKMGVIEEDYVTDAGRVIEGRKKVIQRGYGDDHDRTGWEFYENGQLWRRETYLFCSFEMTGGPAPEQYPLEREELFADGQLVEEYLYSHRHGSIKLHRKVVDGVMVVVFDAISSP